MSRVAAPRAGGSESRVGPRASAWVEGQWERAHYVAPAAGSYPSLALDYGLYIPQTETHTARPLVVMLHGCTQSGDAFARGTRMNVLADRYGFAVLYPEQAAKRHPQVCWHWYDASAAAGGAEAHAIVALVDNLDAGRVYVAGLSAGAGMAAMLAFDYPERFAAVATHSGVVFGAARSVPSALDVMRRGATQEPAELARVALAAHGATKAAEGSGALAAMVAQGVSHAVAGQNILAALTGRGRFAEAAHSAPGHPGIPALLLHGARDEVVNPINLEQLEAQFLVLNGLLDTEGTLVDVTLEASEHNGYRQRIYRRDGRELVKICLVAELGHAWSGGDDTVPFHAGIGPDASLEIWNFFSQAPRRAMPVKPMLKAINTV